MASTRSSGAGVVVTDGDPKMPNTITTLKMRGALHTCSYEEEVEAMEMAATWVNESCNETTSIMICTDSQLLYMAMEALNAETALIKNDLINNRHALDDSVPEECLTCQEPHSLDHWWLRCLGTLAVQREIFMGEDEEGLMVLTKEHCRALALARKTLLGDGPVAAQ